LCVCHFPVWRLYCNSLYKLYILYETTLGVQYPRGLVLFGAPCALKSKPFTQPTWQVQCLYRPAQHLVIATLPSCKTMTSVVKEVYLTRDHILYWIYARIQRTNWFYDDLNLKFVSAVLPKTNEPCNDILFICSQLLSQNKYYFHAIFQLFFLKNMDFWIYYFYKI